VSFKRWRATYRTKADGRVNTLLGHDDVVKLSGSISLAEEAALYSTVLLRRPSTDTMIKEV
jgi:hypothetical protein